MLNFHVSIQAMVVPLPCSTLKRLITKKRANFDRIYARVRVPAVNGKDHWNW